MNKEGYNENLLDILYKVEYLVILKIRNIAGITETPLAKFTNEEDAKEFIKIHRKSYKCNNGYTSYRYEKFYSKGD